AGQAVRLALGWPKRPPLSSVTFPASDVQSIPDDALRVMITGANVPANLQSIHSSPGSGVQPDDPTDSLPLVDVGSAAAPISSNLTGKAALIQFGGNDVAEKLQFAAA